MKSTWKRVLSAMLTVAMIATLLVVPAAAATSYTYNLDTGAQSKAGFFSIQGTASEKTFSKSALVIGDVTYNKGLLLGKSATADSTVKFTGAGTLTGIVAGNSSTGATLDSKRIRLDDNNTQQTTANGGAFSFTIEGTGEHVLYAGDSMVLVYLEFTPPAAADDELTLTFDAAEGAVISDLTVGGAAKDFAATVNVKKNAEITFKVAPKADYYTIKEVKFGTDTLTANESGVYTIADVGTTAATVTVTVESSRVPATSVTLSAETLTFKTGGQAAELTATVAPDNTTDVPSITSSLSTVATWADDKVTPVAIGKTTITATAGEVKDTCEVSVTGPDQKGPVYTFNAGNMGTATSLPDGDVQYDNYFTVKCKGSSVVADAKEFGTADDAWHLNGTQYLAPGTNGSKDQRSVVFTTTADTSTVEVWWKQNASSDATPVQRDISLDGTLASSLIGTAVDGTLENNAFVKNNLYHVTYSNVAKGAHYVAAANGGGEYIFQIVVTESTGKTPSAAPKFATGGDVGQVQKDGKVTFTLDSDAPQGASYKLYNAATEGTQMGANAGVVASEGKITFTLTDGQLTGTDNVTWYVSATEVDTPESTTRTAVTVKPYIPVTSVSLVHFTTTDPGTGESHEPDHAGTVGHVLYEKMKETDADLIGPGEDGAELPETARPNGWKLKAVVKPDNATNKEVVFSNVRVTPEFINVAKDGTVTAIKAGTGRIRVSSVSEPDITAAFDLTVMVRIGAVEIQNADGTAAATTLAMGKTLPLKAVVTASASASASHQAVTWSSSDETVATVSATGVVTPVKAGTVKITATSNLDNTVKGELELTVTKGTPELAFTTGNPQVTSGGAVRFKLTGVPAGVTPTFTVEQNGAEVNTVTVEALENDDNYNYKATMPANATGATVTYTVTAKVAADANWNAAEKSVEVAVLDASAKNIFIVSPGTTKAVEMTKGGSAKLEVIAQVNGAGQVKDDAATAALTYAWTKDGTAMSDTTYAITVDAAGEYVCTVTSADTAVVAKQVAVTFTVTVVAPAMTTIDVTADSGVDYNAATGALKITGPVDATFTVTTGPDGHEDTVATPTSSTPSVARVSMTGDKLTITPWSVGTTVITLQGTKATDVKKEITVTVVKAPAPAALTESDYTVTQPTTEGGKGTITITQNAPAGTEYVYRLGDDGAWITFPTDTKSIEVAPGIYKIRVRVPRPELQETTNGVAVEIKAFTAAPTVSTVRVSSPTDSVAVGATVQMTAEVRMSDNAISKTETVTWSVSDATVADISTTGLVTGLKAGTVTVTATSNSDAAKKGVKTLIVTEKQGVDKAALAAAVADAEGVYAIGSDVEVLPAGTKAGTVTKGQKFVTRDVYDALAQAIADAKAVLDDADATQAEVEAAATALIAAKDAFKVLTGTKGSGSSSRPSSRPTRPTETVTKDENGNTATKTTDTQGNTTITVTAENGETVAKVDLPANIPSVGYKFVDVPEEHWAEQSINDLAGLGMVKGVNEEEHIYDMTSPVTRGSVATILFRASQGKAGIAANFSDVAADAWYADAVGWAAKYGVVTGFEDGTFAADASITREQLALMLYRYAKLLGMDVKTTGNLDGFVDTAEVSTWAAEAMTWAVGAGVIKGTDAKELNPADAASRAETACMIDRFVGLMK